MNILGIVGPTSSALSNYDQSKSCRELADQPFLLGMIALQRIGKLQLQLRTISPTISFGYFSILPLGLAIIQSIPRSEAKKYLDELAKNNDSSESIQKKLCEGIVSLGNISEKILQHSDKMLNVAACVTYVALISFGFTTIGVIGLTGLLLIAIKSNGYMPKQVDCFLDPVSTLFGLIVLMTDPMSIPLRIFCLIPTMVFIINKILPPECKHPFHGMHVMEEPSTDDWKNIHNLVEKPDNFTVEPTYIYSNELEEIYVTGSENLLKKKGLRWEVHCLLAKMRDGFVREGVVNFKKEYDKGQKTLPELLKKYLKTFDGCAGEGEAGIDNVTKTFEKVYWHRFRTYEGEVMSQSEKKSPIENLINQKLLSRQPTKLGYLEVFYISFKLGKNNFAAAAIYEINKLMQPHFGFPGQIVDKTYKAVKLGQEYKFDSKGVLQRSRAIQWNLVEEWMKESKFDNKISFRNEDDSWNEKWVEMDDSNNPSLTTAGVRLLLWDMGILKINK